MVINLRKGTSSVYLQYPTVGDSMGAGAFQAEVTNDTLVLRFEIKPIDSNQKMDEDHLHEMELLSMTINDDSVTSKFIEFVKPRSFSVFHLEIVSRGECLIFNVTVEPSRMDGLTFNIESKVR